MDYSARPKIPYIYESNKDIVRPIRVKQCENNKRPIGTCFDSTFGIVTAKHCVDGIGGYYELKIDGVSADILKSAKIFSHKDIDLVLIKPQKGYNWKNKFTISDGAILDEVMVMGYPDHYGFDRFLTATTGAIAAVEQPNEQMHKHKLMLLTGKIKGGNSGGPVLNSSGEVVGIVIETTNTDGDFDKFGYGVAIPSSYLQQLTEEIKNDFNFVDEIE